MRRLTITILLIMTINAANLPVTQAARKIILPREDLEAWLQKHSWTHHQMGRGELPPGYRNLGEFQLAAICADPVLWAYFFLRDPDEPERPYVFFDYQKASIRDKGNTLHECGAEVGKTREITAYILWKAFTVARGSGLVTAPQQTHLDEIIDDALEQLSLNPLFKGSLIAHKKHPHHRFVFSNKFKIYFRPTGHDGTALRGIHVKTFAIMDEAAKAKNWEIFKEFWRAMKPHCVAKIYSVPDGDRSTDFFKLCKRADSKEEKKDDDHERLTKGTPKHFTKYRWGKPLMPPPFFTKERRRFYIDQYGGETSPGYQQNVLGNWGDPENSVFPWERFKLILKDVPEYRVLKVLVDKSQGEVSLFGATYSLVIGSGPATEHRETILTDTRTSESGFNIVSEIKSFFNKQSGGLYFGGVDLGYSQDPTEIIVKLILGKTHRIVARVHMKGVTYDQQCAAIAAIDDIYDSGKNDMGWGLDMGNAGSAVVPDLHNLAVYAHKEFADRLVGFQFNSSLDAIDEEGEPVIDGKTGKPVRTTAKELATDLLTKKMQRQELEYPYDPDITLWYPNHTYWQGGRHRIFKKEDDHLIDADRVCQLRIVHNSSGFDFFL